MPVYRGPWWETDNFFLLSKYVCQKNISCTHPSEILKKRFKKEKTKYPYMLEIEILSSLI
jgi:hypothetical protein